LAYANRGLAYYRKGDYEHALADDSQAIALDPKYAVVYDNRGFVYEAKGYYDRAIADFDRSITLDPKNAGFYNDRGFAYEAKGDYDRAIADYDQAIALNPTHGNAYFHRGLASLYVGSLAKALTDLDRSIELVPNPYTALWRDIVDKRSNQPSQLPTALTQIDMIKWPAPLIRLYIGKLTPAEALAAADDPDANTKKEQVCEANFYIGELALQQENKEEATRLFRLAADDCPKNFNEWPAARAELRALGLNPE
jgi:tetratricopeptide (TPR) repeat protein